MGQNFDHYSKLLSLCPTGGNEMQMAVGTDNRRTHGQPAGNDNTQPLMCDAMIIKL